ncbi:MAG TPA: aminoacyl-tRNA hydrolase [Pseudomonadota bacterium]|nr:aminoacyl-tRNA hydrolase [Pseudomonadota bacterium]
MDAGWLVVGLGNPGSDYAGNRHNVGFMVVDELARRWGAGPGAFRGKFGSELLSLDYRGRRIHLQKPQEYMNVSGGPVQRAMAFFRIVPAQVLVIHDEIDLPFLRLQVKAGGGHGGHNGLRSISQAVGSDYLRLRFGVGRPEHPQARSDSRERVSGHVLGDFGRAEQSELGPGLERACEAVEMILEKGITPAMNEYNRERKPATKAPGS